MQSVILFLLLPILVNAQGWKIDQPHKYIIINGEYIELPVEERDSQSPSLLSSLNPMNAFQNFWSSLNFLKNEDSEHPDEASPGIAFEQTEESAPSGISVPFSSYFSNPVSSFSSLGNLFSGVGGFMKKSSNFESYPEMGSLSHHHINKRNSEIGSKEKNHPKGPVRYLYKAVGQGGFIRYEIPILTPEELALEQEQRDKRAKNISPIPLLEMHDFEGHKEHSHYYSPLVDKKFNPKQKPQYTKPYYHDENVTYKPTDSQIGNDNNNGKTKETSQTSSTEATVTENPFPCPKVGFWTYNGRVCTATHAIPPWSCKPIDLAQSGKLVVCRNKVYY